MRMIVAGGGTGGHIYPALSLIHEVKKQDAQSEILYIGTENGLESQIVKREGINFKAIEVSGFKRKLSFENIKTLWRFWQGVSKSKRYIKAFNPDIVVGTGGYVCGPVVYAATKLAVPTLIHEQNSVPGLTNKFLSRYVDRIAICFEEAEAFFPKNKTILTGNPRASEVVNVKSGDGKTSFGLDPNRKVVLIVGGSRGARPINRSFLEALPEAAERDYQFLYVTGEAHYEEVVATVKKQGNPSNVVIKPFLHHMPEVLSFTDLIVARAGATTLAEITALGLPSILIPSPYVTNNHQEKNARALGDKGAAIVRLEQDMTGSGLLSDIDGVLLDTKKLADMRKAAKSMGIPDAADRLYQLTKTIASKNE